MCRKVSAYSGSWGNPRTPSPPEDPLLRTTPLLHNSPSASQDRENLWLKLDEARTGFRVILTRQISYLVDVPLSWTPHPILGRSAINYRSNSHIPIGRYYARPNIPVNINYFHLIPDRISLSKLNQIIYTGLNFYLLFMQRLHALFR